MDEPQEFRPSCTQELREAIAESLDCADVRALIDAYNTLVGADPPLSIADITK